MMGQVLCSSMEKERAVTLNTNNRDRAGLGDDEIVIPSQTLGEFHRIVSNSNPRNNNNHNDDQNISPLQCNMTSNSNNGDNISNVHNFTSPNNYKHNTNIADEIMRESDNSDNSHNDVKSTGQIIFDLLQKPIDLEYKDF